MLAGHDRNRFEVYAFDNGRSDGSELRRRVKAAVTEVVPWQRRAVGRAAGAHRHGYHLPEPRQRLAALRATLQAQLPTAPLFDSARYTQHLEAAYAAMVQRARRGQAPAPIVIAAQD